MRFLPVLLLTSALIAQTNALPDARALLMRSGGSALMADTIRLEGTESTDQVSESGHVEATAGFTLERATNGRMRWESTAGTAKVLQIADGKAYWTYFSVSHSYMKVAHSNEPTNDPYSRLKFSRDPKAFDGAKVEREESLEFGGEKVPCVVVQAAYKSMPGNPAAREITRTVWIAKSDDRALRDVWDFNWVPGGTANPVKARITDEYKVIESGIPLPDDSFVFVPPEGSREITVGAPTHANPPAGIRYAPIHEVKPEYTEEARRAGLQGTISLYVEIETGGHPSTVQVMQGLGLGLDERAVEAVKQSEYPAAATTGHREVDVEFRLASPAPWDVTGEAYTVTIPEGQRVDTIVKPVPVRYVAPDPAACQSPGTVMLYFAVGADGSPRLVRASDSYEGPLAAAAVKAVEGWLFEPAALDGKTAEARAAVEFECQPGGMILQSERPPLPVYRVGGGVGAPVLLAKVEPEYSEEARKAKLQGANLFYVQISPEGKATSIMVVRSLGLGLDEKAMEAVKRWRFKPGMKDGKPVTVEATIEVNFKLL